MVTFSANLSMLYPEIPFLDRFAAAAEDGFSAVEFLFPYEYPANQLRQRLDDYGLTQVLFNAPPGDWNEGERGVASLQGRGDEFRAGIDRALEYAHELGCKQVHVMSGVLHDTRQRYESWQRYRDSLAWAAVRAAPTGVRLLLEPLNTRDMPGYLLTRQRAAHALVNEIDPRVLGVQLDLYHCQIAEGDLTTTIARDLPSGHVKHIQIAGVPNRNEPDRGEVDFAHVLKHIDRLNYEGIVGLEYRPAADTREGLSRFISHIRQQGVVV